jgi:predicted nucleic acid-binding Zn ribbon protein
VTPSLRAQVLREWQPHLAPPSPSKSALSLDRLVPAVMKGLGLETRLQQSELYFFWPQIVGVDVARHAQPVSFRNRILVVAVDHPIWLQELSRYHKSLLLQKLRARIGLEAIRDIIFRIG